MLTARLNNNRGNCRDETTGWRFPDERIVLVPLQDERQTIADDDEAGAEAARRHLERVFKLQF